MAAHGDYVVYKLTPQTSLFDAYANSKLVEWRRSLAFFGAKQSPCNTCNRGQFAPTPETRAVFDAIAPWLETAG